ncbi:membrane protein [soil metagenome]
MKRPLGAVPFVLAVFAASRVLFLGAGALAVAFITDAEPAGDPLGPGGVLGYWARWDGAWYSEISTEGYDARYPASTAFFPLYPLLIRLGTLIGGGPALWGVGISLAATFFALYFIYRIAEHLYDVRAARAATLATAFFPTAFFLNAVYTEALFLALSAGCIWAAMVRRDLFLAAVLGALAAFTRSPGVLLAIPLALEWWRYRRELGASGLASLALVPAGIGAYLVFLWARFGEPLVFFSQQEEYWGRELASPAVTLSRGWSAAGEGATYLSEPFGLLTSPTAGPTLAASNTLNLAFLALFLVIMGAGVVLLPPGLSLYAVALVFAGILAPSPDLPLMSLPRFLLGAFPMFLVLGLALSRSRLALWSWLPLSGAMGAWMAALFVTWHWVA